MKTLSAFVVAGTHSGVGKTVVATGLMAALNKRGVTVQPFKAGARPLDGGYHQLATGRSSINLDLWLMPPDAIKATFARRSAESGAAVVDGMRGLFDGSSLAEQPVSTQDLANLLDLPILLVVDASGAAESVAATVKGFVALSKRVVGIILNRVLGERHLTVMRTALESAGDAPVLGYLPTDPGLEFEASTLDFVPATHYQLLEPVLPGLIEQVEKTINLQRILDLTRINVEAKSIETPKARVRIAVARDAAFPFMYEGNIALLQQAGAEIVPFSPMRDAAPPSDIGGMYLGAGIPEVCSSALERNQPMREKMRAVIETGIPVYAECGGLQYLATNIVGTGVRAWDMTGILPGEIRLHERMPSLGWVIAEAVTPSFLMKRGETVRGYDFRAFTWSGMGGDRSAYRLRRPGEKDGRLDGIVHGNLHASFCHLHFSSKPELAERFVEAAEDFAKKGGPKKKTLRSKKQKQKSPER